MRKTGVKDADSHCKPHSTQVASRRPASRNCERMHCQPAVGTPNAARPAAFCTPALYPRRRGTTRKPRSATRRCAGQQTGRNCRPTRAGCLRARPPTRQPARNTGKLRKKLLGRQISRSPCRATRHRCQVQSRRTRSHWAQIRRPLAQSALVIRARLTRLWNPYNRPRQSEQRRRRARESATPWHSKGYDASGHHFPRFSPFGPIFASRVGSAGRTQQPRPA